MIPSSDACPLAVILPVFNEARALPAVLEEWMPVLERVAGNFLLLAIDDGSTDATPTLLAEAAQRWPDRIRVVSHVNETPGQAPRHFGGSGSRPDRLEKNKSGEDADPPEMQKSRGSLRGMEPTRINRGHGQSCLAGYRLAAESGAEWVFQIDSDGQCDPAFFEHVWELRKSADVVYGVRVRREDGWKRVLASALLRLLVRIRCGVWCADPNSPYRLMRSTALSKAITEIPPDFFLANVALAALLRRRNVLHASTPIRFRARIGGEPSVPLRSFGQRALELWKQLGSLRVRND